MEGPEERGKDAASAMMIPLSDWTALGFIPDEKCGALEIEGIKHRIKPLCYPDFVELC